MGRHQLGIDLSEGGVDAIVAFFGALAGEIPHDDIGRPPMPETPGRAARGTVPQ